MDQPSELEGKSLSALADQALADNPPVSNEMRARESGGTPVVPKHAAVFPRDQEEVQTACPLSAARPSARSPLSPLTHMGSFPRDNQRTEHGNPRCACLKGHTGWRWHVVNRRNQQEANVLESQLKRTH
jgi:hypothetical protein